MAENEKPMWICPKCNTKFYTPGKPISHGTFYDIERTFQRVAVRCTGELIRTPANPPPAEKAKLDTAAQLADLPLADLEAEKTEQTTETDIAQVEKLDGAAKTGIDNLTEASEKNQKTDTGAGVS